MTENNLKRKQQNRIRGRIIFGLAAGIVGHIYSHWTYLIYVGLIYSFFEAIWMFKTTKSFHSARTMEIRPGESTGYAISLTFIQFILSTFLILTIGSLIKLVLTLF